MNGILSTGRLYKMKEGLSSVFILILFIACGCHPDTGYPFSFKESSEGVELFESGKAVFFYQKALKSLDTRYVCNNYIHPLYSLEGDELTEEFPADHPYHRGIFWAWHQMFINEQSIGNNWIMENISLDVTKLKTSTDKGKARLDIDVNWKSSLWHDENPYMHEHTTILVHRTKGIRKIDFEIRLKGLTPGLSIGGADDEKGYGGLCLRIKTPEDLTFTSANGTVSPQSTQITAGSWMDFSGTFNPSANKNGIILLCHPTTPNYPQNWILRQSNSMQNIVYPGRERVEIPVDKEIILRYRLIIHKGSHKEIDIPKMKAEYDKFIYPDKDL